MQSFPKLLAGAAVIVMGSSLYYFQSSEQQLLDEAPAPTSKQQPIEAQSPALNAIVSATQTNVNIKTKASTAAQLSAEDILEQPDSNSDYETFKDRFSEIRARRNGQEIDAVQLWQASQQPAAWQPLATPPDSLNLSQEEKNDGRSFITFSPLKLESLVAGDTLEIEMGHSNQSFTAKIEAARSEDNGKNVTWTGTSLDADFPGRLTITKGDTLIVGGISTPDGHYELQVHGDKGWIVNSATIFKGVDQQVTVPQHLLENPPKEVVYLPTETFGEGSGNH